MTPEDEKDPTEVGDDDRLYIQLGDQMRVRVISEHFNMAGSTRPPKATPGGIGQPAQTASQTVTSPYTLEVRS
jgi:DNA-directed RNA polymerase subunit E'/Rpb7